MLLNVVKTKQDNKKKPTLNGFINLYMWSNRGVTRSGKRSLDARKNSDNLFFWSAFYQTLLLYVEKVLSSLDFLLKVN